MKQGLGTASGPTNGHFPLDTLPFPDTFSERRSPEGDLKFQQPKGLPQGSENRGFIMPIYEFKCTNTACNNVEEHFMRHSDPLPTNCEKCASPIEKMVSQTSFALKGSGWYVTDYKGSNASSSASSSNASSSSSESKSDSSAASSTDSATCGAPACGTSGCASN